MASPTANRSDVDKRVLVPSGVLGMLLFIFTEVMLFAGLISAFSIVKSSALVWPPYGQPRLPIEETALNTAALLLSGVLLYVANRRFAAGANKAKGMLLASILLGAFFVIFQGAEWVALINEGLTLTSSTHGSFFYLIIGLHAVHAAAALLVLAVIYVRLRKDALTRSAFWTAQVFWYFVVGVWPVLYWQVYL